MELVLPINMMVDQELLLGVVETFPLPFLERTRECCGFCKTEENLCCRVLKDVSPQLRFRKGRLSPMRQVD